MTLTIRRDERRQAGGYAVLSFADAPVPGATVTLAVMETFGGRWLAPSAGAAEAAIGIGDPNWQAGRHDFGPYAVTPEGTGFQITIGPEIVNKIEGYTNLRLIAGPVAGTASWPDDIAPLAGAAASGGLQVMRKAPQAPPLRAARAQETEPEIAIAEPPVGPGPTPIAPPKYRLAPLLGIGALVVLGLGVVAWVLIASSQTDAQLGTAPPPVAPQPVEPRPVEPAPVPVPARPPETAESCTLEALRAAPGGLAEQLVRVGDCGNAVGADTLLSLIEDAAATDDPAALMLFGALYDAGETDALAEGAVGLTFGDAPAQAAEYYSRAAAAGAPEAAARLARACDALETATDTLSQGARDDFCP